MRGGRPGLRPVGGRRHNSAETGAFDPQTPGGQFCTGVGALLPGRDVRGFTLGWPGSGFLLSQGRMPRVPKGF